ncbi:MAG: AGE family epimerase/isomerase [Bacteroidota bacterium]
MGFNMELNQYKKELEEELKNILDYWMNNTIDLQYGGFIGKIDDKNIIYPEAPKGSVLNARILWTFSAAYNKTREKKFLLIADRAFEYLHTCFIDKEYGGVYWTVDYTGQPLDTKNQVYALAFVIYACSEYHKCTGNEKSKTGRG